MFDDEVVTNLLLYFGIKVFVILIPYSKKICKSKTAVLFFYNIYSSANSCTYTAVYTMSEATRFRDTCQVSESHAFECKTC
jgi:hypothetical protein